MVNERTGKLPQTPTHGQRPRALLPPTAPLTWASKQHLLAGFAQPDAMDAIAALIFCRELPAGDAVQSESTFPPAGGPPSAPSGEGRGRRGRRGVTRSMVTTLGPKMAAEWGGGAGYSGSGPGRSRWRWSGSMWVRSVLLLLGGLRASATSTPVSLGSSPPCRHHVPSDTEVGRQGRERALSG